ncbi:ABC-type nitrate/sulfonate/bicarbonate transport systems, periplasmic components [Rhodovastum atsumiense]|uniref:ABC transporter substrate-binding protein n=1 Tax=Rhodovastum atsumiense TaxID=504468 RepID=A0A5M6IMR6_9PROT|nr:ABC transporter substrate-binding protein [Rhodovastum atsumiense]KAA5609257.1 ABC transporter substrate-binding protein [Rhodovastum atsumiense]CAH2601711.1 ABC-type nitrate/sulfonate/bicarbonate transport systems, periplasmic components [Rhodovastum atsumiense]
MLLSPRLLHRRALLRAGGAAMLAAPPGGVAAAAPAEPVPAAKPLSKVRFIWNPAALCNIVVGVAKDQGIFTKHGLDVETLFVGTDTAAILEALSIGKADATSTFLMRLMKPLEAGFDVRLTAGVHAGCSYLIASREAGIRTLQDLRGKRIGVSDLTGPSKFNYAIYLQKNGINPDTDVTWRVYPADVFPIAVEKGEIEAFVDVHPNSYYALKRSNGRLFELASSGTGEMGKRTCCVLAVGGRLLRNDRPVATALTRAMVEAAVLVDARNDIAVESAQRHSPRQVKPEEIGEMIASYPYDRERGCPTGDAFRQHVESYAKDLLEVGILKPSTDPVRFARRYTVDLLG